MKNYEVSSIGFQAISQTSNRNIKIYNKLLANHVTFPGMASVRLPLPSCWEIRFEQESD